MVLPQRKKISVSVSSDLLREIDRGVRQRRYPSRSAAVETALRGLARAQRDAEIEAYYSSRTDDERAEERAWGELGYEGFVAARASEGRVRSSPRPRRGKKR